MGLDRRTFLQQAALALVSVGASEVGFAKLSQNAYFSRWLEPYVTTLAQTTNRKLALLVGINDYAEKSDLAGCVNDVFLQKELLVRCFGFQPEDVHVLSDRKATQQNLESAFNEYLVQQAKSDDVVFLHFSGYGSQVTSGDSPSGDSTQFPNSLILSDSGKQGLSQNRLFEMARSLATSNLITVLDTSFQPTTEKIQGNYRVRSSQAVTKIENAANSAAQELSLNPFRRIALGAQADIPGIVLSAAGTGQLALEGTWNGFSAGLLTYTLTRYLWATNSRATIQVAFQQAVNGVSGWSDKQQQPQITGKLKSNLIKEASVSGVSDRDGGEGFVIESDGKGMLKLSLTALAPTLLDSYDEGACFTISESAANSQLLQLRSLSGITAKAQLIGDSVSQEQLSGKPIQEAIRVLPRDLGLSIALDSHLERIERVDATSAFAQMSRVNSVVVAGEAYADCVIGKISLMVDKSTEAEPHSSESPVYSYGIYTPRGKLIVNTPGEANEAIKLAVKRLSPYFSRLLAAKWLELTVNDRSSIIPVTATIESASRNSALISKTTLRTSKKNELNAEIPTIQGDSPLRMRIDNQSDHDLYGIMIGVDNEEKFATLYLPQATVNTPDSLIVAAGSQQTIPETSSQWQWKAIKPSGITKMYLILATQPFKNTLNLLAKQPVAKRELPELVNVSEPLELVQAILQDLHVSSDVSQELFIANESYGFDVKHWASFNFIYDVI